jgi:hypothetical protein
VTQVLKRWFRRMRPDPNDGQTTVHMGWRYVRYETVHAAIELQIEPMTDGPDLVYVPTETAWREGLRGHRFAAARNVILRHLQTATWNRALRVEEASMPLKPAAAARAVVLGSLEATPGARWLEQQNLFDPGAAMSADEARGLWCELARKFAAAAKGDVHLPDDGRATQGSVWERMELPLLLANPQVTLIRR